MSVRADPGGELTGEQTLLEVRIGELGRLITILEAELGTARVRYQHVTRMLAAVHA